MGHLATTTKCKILKKILEKNHTPPFVKVEGLRICAVFYIKQKKRKKRVLNRTIYVYRNARDLERHHWE